jgi:hypothetical protein
MSMCLQVATALPTGPLQLHSIWLQVACAAKHGANKEWDQQQGQVPLRKMQQDAAFCCFAQRQCKQTANHVHRCLVAWPDLERIPGALG